MPNKKGFTLVEVLLGVVISCIVIASITLGINGAVSMYRKTMAQSAVISGLRFTVDSYNRKILPMLHIADRIEILDKAAAALPGPATLSDDEHYLFLSEDAVVLRSQSGDEALPGSEYISKLAFSLPTDATEAAENYLLSIDITAENDEYETVKKETALKTSLYNRPEKLANHKVNGSVLHFFADENEVVLTATLHLKNDYNHEVIDGVTMPSGSKIYAYWEPDLQTSEGPIPKNEYEDQTEDNGIYWFITASTKDNLPESDSYSDDTDKNLFKLMDLDTNLPYRSIDIQTQSDGKYYISVNNGEKKEWKGKKNIIRCRIEPEVLYKSRRVHSIPKYVYSDYIIMESSKGGFWDAWVEAIDKKNNEGKDTDGFIIRESEKGKISLNADVNTGVITASIFSGAENPDTKTVTSAMLDYDWFDNNRVNSIWRIGKTENNIPSFMTFTNYSAVIEAAMPINNNKHDAQAYFWGLLLNGYNVAQGKDSGYVFQYERKRGYGKNNSGTADKYGLLMRKFDNGNLSGYVGERKDSTKSYGIFNENLNNSANDQSYLPEYLNNDNFNDFNGADAADWAKPRRLKISVLEYYTDNKKKPEFLIRVQFLKPLSAFSDDELTKMKQTDPWCIGKQFFASEPMWFGNFVGNTVAVSNKTSEIAIKNCVHSLKDNLTVKIPRAVVSPDIKRYYGLSPSGKDDSSYIMRGMDDLVANNVDAIRDRFIGFRIFSAPPKGNNKTAVDFNSVAFAPGFSAEEIKAILPAGAHVYEIEETISTEDLATIKQTHWYKNFKSYLNQYYGGSYNTALFGDQQSSIGNGKSSLYYTLAGYVGGKKAYGGIYDIQHLAINDCKCPLHNEWFKWITDPIAISDIITGFSTLIDNQDSKIIEYFAKDKFKDGKTLDSNGKNLAPPVLAELVKLIPNEPDLSNYSWVIELHSKTSPLYYDIYWSFYDVSLMTAGEQIDIYKATYTPSTHTIGSLMFGMATVSKKTVENKSFMVILTDTFKSK